MVEKVKKAFTMLFVLVLMMANLPALASALEQTKDISDVLSAKAELQTQKDGNWTALKDQAEVEKGVALKLKVDYMIPAEPLEKAIDQASQLEATITLPDGADFVTDQADNQGTITAPDEKTAIGAYSVATASNGAQVLKLSLKSEEVVKEKIGELKASATLNAILKDPQEKQTLKFDSEKIQFSNTNRTDIQLNVPSVEAENTVTATSATKEQDNKLATEKSNTVTDSSVQTDLNPDILSIVTPATVYKLDNKNGTRTPITKDDTLTVGDNIQVELNYFISPDQINRIANTEGNATVDIPLDISEGFSYPKGTDDLMATVDGKKEKIGEYTIVQNTDGKYVIRVTYNDYIKNHSGVSGFGSKDNPGHMDVNFQVVKAGEKQHIVINGDDTVDNKVVTPAEPDGTNGNLGPINKYGARVGQSNTINWALNINYSGLIQEATTGHTAATAYNKITGNYEDAQFKNSVILDVLPQGIHFDIDGKGEGGEYSALNAYMPVFFYNEKNGFIYDGPLTYVSVKMTYQALTGTDAASLAAAQAKVASSAPGIYSLYTNNTGAPETATLYGVATTLQKGQEVLLVNTGDIGYAENEVPGETPGTFRNPKTIPLKDTMNETIWNDQVADAIKVAQKKIDDNAPDKINFNSEKTLEGTEKLYKANDPYFNGGYHFDIRTIADNTFDKDKQSKVHNDVIIGYNNKSDKNSSYDVDWRKGDSDIDGNIAKGTVLIQKKAMSSTDDDAQAADLNDITFELTNTDKGANPTTYTAKTGPYKNDSAQIINGVAAFKNLPSGHYEIREYSDGTDITKDIYVWDVANGKYRPVDQNDPQKDLSFVINRDSDSSGFAYALYNKRDSVTVEKQWQDNNSANRPTSVKVDLIANYEKESKVVGTQTLSGDNSWKYTWDNLLPIGTSTSEGKLSSYTVKEDPVPDGYTSQTSNVTETETKDKEGVVTSTDYAYTITNSIKQSATELTVNKVWYDRQIDGDYTPDPLKIRPEKVTIHLKADGEAAKDIDGNVIPAVQLTSDGEWTHTFTNLPKYKTDGKTSIAYTVEEDPVNGYTSKVTIPSKDGVILVMNTIEEIKISGKKTWLNSNDVVIPKKIRIELYANGKFVYLTNITKNEDWAYTFTALPKYDKDGKEFVYTVKEFSVNDQDGLGYIDGFVAKYSRVAASLAAGTTDYSNYKVQFYDDKGAKAGEPIALTKSADKTKWNAVYSISAAENDADIQDFDNGQGKSYSKYTAKLVDPDGNIVDGVEVSTATTYDISNTYKMPLPMTGGSGIQKIILIGLSALMISGLYIFWRKRNRKEVA